MGKILRNLKSFSGGLLGMTVMLIALFFVLNYLSSRGWGPLSNAATWAQSHANGSAYGGSAPVVGVPSTNSNGPAL